MAFCDDTVYWPNTFLQHTSALFEDTAFGAVTTRKLVNRNDHGLFSWEGFWNFIGCVFLERRNFEQAAVNNIDGGISTLSGRSFIARACILKDVAYQEAYLNEYFGGVGPLNAGEDKFTTRWMLNNGWKIHVQHAQEVTVITELGTYPRYLRQLLRWSRTSWRSNLHRFLFEPHHLVKQPWSFYAIYLQSMTNFALFYDIALVFTLWYGIDQSEFMDRVTPVTVLISWIVTSKLIKLIPHFVRCPSDLVYFPAYILFVYYFTFHRIYTLFTCCDISWGSRPGVDDFTIGQKLTSIMDRTDDLGGARNSE